MTDIGLEHGEERFGTVARWLHWAMFALIALQIVGGQVMEELPRRTPIRALAFDTHETIGLIVLFLVFVRLAWRMAHPGPGAQGPRWQRAAARAAHVGLYVLMLAVPVVGYLMVDAKGYDVAFFRWAAPDLLATDKRLADRFEDLHSVLAGAMVAFVVAHVGAALWHHFVVRDGTLNRMLPARR